MDKRSPVSAYKLFSSPSNKKIVLDSFYETPCIYLSIPMKYNVRDHNKGSHGLTYFQFYTLFELTNYFHIFQYFYVYHFCLFVSYSVFLHEKPSFYMNLFLIFSLLFFMFFLYCIQFFSKLDILCVISSISLNTF